MLGAWLKRFSRNWKYLRGVRKWVGMGASNKKLEFLWWTSYWRGENQTRHNHLSFRTWEQLTLLAVWQIVSFPSWLHLRSFPSCHLGLICFCGSEWLFWALSYWVFYYWRYFWWLFLILGFRQKSFYAGFPTFSPIFLANLILHLPNGLPVHASTTVPRQSLGMYWSIVLVLALFFSESDTLSLEVRHWLNKAAS